MRKLIGGRTRVMAEHSLRNDGASDECRFVSKFCVLLFNDLYLLCLIRLLLTTKSTKSKSKASYLSSGSSEMKGAAEKTMLAL